MISANGKIYYVLCGFVAMVVQLYNELQETTNLQSHPVARRHTLWASQLSNLAGKLIEEEVYPIKVENIAPDKAREMGAFTLARMDTFFANAYEDFLKLISILESQSPGIDREILNYSTYVAYLRAIFVEFTKIMTSQPLSESVYFESYEKYQDQVSDFIKILGNEFSESSLSEALEKTLQSEIETLVISWRTELENTANAVN